MAEKYQLDNPNNCRIFIDYRRDKSKVEFDYVAQDSIFSLAKNIYLGLLLRFPLLPIWSLSFFIGLFLNIKFLAFSGVLIYFFFYLVLPLLTIKSKKLLRLIPLISTLGVDKYEAIFKSEDIKENKIEIPLFRNVMLNYKATEEMSKHLQRVEITEHNFNYYISVKKKKRNPYLWRAIFYFSNKPTSGELKVLFH